MQLIVSNLGIVPCMFKILNYIVDFIYAFLLRYQFIICLINLRQAIELDWEIKDLIISLDRL